MFFAAAAFVAALAVLTVSLQAEAQEGFRTTPNGSPLRWRQKSAIQVTLDESLLAIDERAFEVARAGLSTWLAEDAGQPLLTFGETSKGTLGYARGPSCTVIYKPEGDPIAGNALAVTITTYDEKTGTIYDADILINGGPERRFARLEGDADEEKKADRKANKKEPERDVYDLQNVLTHEGGHFFGLADFPNSPAATMYPITAWGELGKRTLESEDVTSLVGLYATDDTVDPPGGCGGVAASVGGGAGHRAAWLLAFACALIASARRFPRLARWAAPPVALALLALGALAAPGAARSAARVAWRADASARVASVRLLREGPVLRSEVELTALRCRGARCPDAPRRVTLPGGSDGAIAQRVGHQPPAHLGDAIELSVPGALRWVAALSPALAPVRPGRHEPRPLKARVAARR